MKKNRIISVSIILLIFLQIFFPICMSNAAETDEKEIYDVILFWGQSNMTGYCGSYEGERTKDTRYNYADASSVKAFSEQTGIDEEILSNSVKMNYVKVQQEPKTTYEYYYIGDKLQELSEETQYSGEQLKYNSSTKKLEATTSPYSIQISDGTNVIPQFCQTYYNEYCKKTGHKVVAVLASNGGEEIENFLPSTDTEYGDSSNQLIYEAMLEKYTSAINCVEKNNGVVGNKLWVCFQGEANVRNTSTAEYKRLFLKVHNYIKRDFGITKGAIIETSHTIGLDLYDQVNNIHNAQEELANENNDIIIGSRYAYNRYVPNQSTYNSTAFKNDIFTDSNGNKMSYTDAFNKASYSTCYPTNNTIHFTSAALSQIGKETAESLAEELKDKVAPQLQIKYDTTKKTNKDVTVTISANEDIQEISGWTRSTDRRTLTKKYEKNATEEVIIYDIEGNETKATVKIENIDKVSPNVSVIYSEKNLTNKDIEVSLIADEEIQELEGWNLSEDKKTLKKTYTRNTTEEITLFDIAGNSQTGEIKITNIDKTNPNVSVEYSTTKNTNKNVEVTISSDKELQEMEGWTRTQDKKKLIKSYERNTEEKVKISDEAGNEVMVDIKISNIDKIAPKLTIRYSTKELTKEPIIVDIVADEEIQEVEGWTLLEDKKALNKKYNSNANEIINVYDIAGNKANADILIENIDNVEFKVEIRYSTTEKTNEDVKVEILSNKEIEEVEGWTRSQDRKKLEKTYIENGQERLILRDFVGNEINSEIEVSNIDKQIEEIEVVYDKTEITNKDVEVKIISNEEIQEVEGWTRSQDRKELIKKYMSNTKEIVKIKDIAGNSKDIEIEVKNIDKEKPEVDVIYSTTKSTNKNITVDITSNKELQEVKGWTLSDDKKKLTKIYEENKEELIEIYDLAGNSTKVSISIKNIDKNKEIKPEQNESDTYVSEEVIGNKVLPKILPFTGIGTMILVIVLLTAISIILYIKNRKMRDIK